MKKRSTITTRRWPPKHSRSVTGAAFEGITRQLRSSSVIFVEADDGNQMQDNGGSDSAGHPSPVPSSWSKKPIPDGSTKGR
ncbi:hypothetical protein CVT26_004960 [Gymnopilus dilepis]|uniref:Uncharacterized protein n=1 Tax=Gymnopilus dilepis TaxID=231916 RepID=A0A409XZY2_9AGAR|nr:hypothetical protein CVT26_004960 [Gymnopilus dilepis]